jgi:hypothetical protein
MPQESEDVGMAKVIRRDDENHKVEIEIDPDQAWFWTPEWQAGEEEASEDIAAGRVKRYYSSEEFLAAFGTDEG